MNRTAWKGILFAIASATLYGLCAVLTKIATRGTLGVGALMFGRGLSGMMFLLVPACRRRKLPKISRQSVPKIALYGILGTAATQIFLNLAYFYLPVGTTTTIHFLYPALVTASSALLFRQRIPRVTVLTLVISTGSMFLLFEGVDSGQFRGVIYAVMSVLCWSFQMLYMERSGVLEEDRQSLTFFVCLAMAMTGLVYGWLTGTLQLKPLLANAGIVALIGFLNNVCATICLQNGIKFAGAGLSAVFSVFEPISSIILGSCLLNERLGTRQIVSCALILTSICVMMIWNVKGSKTQKT